MDLTSSLIGSSFTPKKVSDDAFLLQAPSINIEVVSTGRYTIFCSSFLVKLFNRGEKLRLMPNTLATTVEIKSEAPGVILKHDEFYVIPVNYQGVTAVRTGFCYNFDLGNVTKSVMVGGNFIELPGLKYELHQTDDCLILHEL